MEPNVKKEGWVYVFVCDPGGSESFLGLYNEEKKINFIPVFRSKDEANDCFLTMPREKGRKYELQAVHIDELNEQATANDFTVAFFDSDGNLVAE